MTSILRIFVTTQCPGCDEAREMAAHIRRAYPDLNVELVDIGDDNANVPDVVFATPTYMLDNRVVSLGNPSPADVDGWVKEAMTNLA